MREIDHAGHDHVVVVRVILILIQKRFNLTGADFSVMVRQGQHFMPAKLDCAASCTLMCPVLAAITP